MLSEILLELLCSMVLEMAMPDGLEIRSGSLLVVMLVARFVAVSGADLVPRKVRQLGAC